MSVDTKQSSARSQDLKGTGFWEPLEKAWKQIPPPSLQIWADLGLAPLIFYADTSLKLAQPCDFVTKRKQMQKVLSSEGQKVHLHITL